MSLAGVKQMMARLDRLEAQLLPKDTCQLRINLVPVGAEIPEGTLVLTPHGSLAFQMPEMPTADGLPGPLPENAPADPSPSTPEDATPAQGPFRPLPTRRLRSEPDINSELW